MANTATLETADPSSRPWSTWESPRSSEFMLNELTTKVENNTVILYAPSETGDKKIGKIDDHQSLNALGIYIGYPPDFVEKLSVETRVQVINERAKRSAARKFQAISVNDSIISLASAKREVLDARIIADASFNALSELYKVDVDLADNKTGLNLKLMTSRQDEITPREGDILRYGLDVQYTYGNQITVSLYSDRLYCDNGAYHTESRFSWRTNENKTSESQIQFVLDTIKQIDGEIDAVTAHSRVMAETRFDGNWQDALRLRMEAMRIPKSYHQRVLDQYEIEPGDTEWHLMNAVTRFATHAEGLSSDFRRSTQRSGGEWATNFDLVNCRMPRTLANRVHAQIIEDVVEA